MTLSEIVHSFTMWAASKLASATVRQYQPILNRFLKATGDIALDAIKPIHLVSWAKTWHDHQAVVRLFNWAVDVAEVLPRNPFRKVKAPVRGQRERVLTRKDVARMLRAARRHFRWFLLVMRETIARPQEVRAFCWEFIQWPDPTKSIDTALIDGEASFVLEKFKCKERRTDSKSKRVIPISRRLGRLIVRLGRKCVKRSGHVFLNQSHRPWTKNAIRCRMRRLRTRCEFLNVDHRGEKVVAYTMRHSMATIAATVGIRDRLLAEMMGHTDAKMTARYQHLDVEHVRSAIEKVSGQFRKKPA